MSSGGEGWLGQGRQGWLRNGQALSGGGGEEWHGRCGLVRRVQVCQGPVGIGTAGTGWLGGLGFAVEGMAWQVWCGRAGIGSVRCGEVGQGR